MTKPPGKSARRTQGNRSAPDASAAAAGGAAANPFTKDGLRPFLTGTIESSYPRITIMRSRPGHPLGDKKQAAVSFDTECCATRSAGPAIIWDSVMAATASKATDRQGHTEVRNEAHEHRLGESRDGRIRVRTPKENSTTRAKRPRRQPPRRPASERWAKYKGIYLAATKRFALHGWRCGHSRAAEF